MTRQEKIAAFEALRQTAEWKKDLSEWQEYLARPSVRAALRAAHAEEDSDEENE